MHWQAIIDGLQTTLPRLVTGIHLFDVYTGQPVPEGKKSVAFALRFRAADRTLTDAEVASARDAAVARAASDWGAELRA